MRKNLKTLVAVFALVFAAAAAYAEDVRISTYYPSPYGSYQTLETNILQGAAGTGNVAMVPTGGSVGIRNGNGVAPGSLLDIGNSTLASAAIINVNAAAAQSTGINLQSAGTNRWSMYRPASSTDLRFSDGAIDRVELTNTGTVNIGSAPNPGQLNIAGDISITGAGHKLKLVSNASPAATELGVDCSSGPCYAIAVYS